MSTEASLAIESTPAEAVRDAEPIKEATPVKATEGPSLARAAAQHHQLSKTAQLAVLPHRIKQHKLSSEAAGAGDRNASAPATPAPPSSANPPSATVAAQDNLTPAVKATGVSPALATHNNQNAENVSSSVSAPEDLQKETALSTEIVELWSSHKTKSSSLSDRRVELQTLRNTLGELLSSYKELLARTGRGGKWTEFLRQEKIPRATADRYVNRWKLSNSPQLENRLSESISEPTREEIVSLVKKLKPRLGRVLTTQDSVALFMAELTTALQPSQSAA
jgi:hypothetical protein